MGYANYYGADKWTDEDRVGYEKALPLVRKIVRKYKNLLQRDLDDKRRPVVNKEKIWFNGIGELGHETFVVTPSVQSEFCKTARRPYDAAVCEVLLVLNAFIPSFTLGSDGFYGYVEDQKERVTLDENWDAAIENVREMFGLEYHAEIVSTHGGRDGEPDPYCQMEVIFDGCANAA